MSELTKSLDAALIHGTKFRRTLRYIKYFSTLTHEKNILLFDYYPSLFELFLFKKIENKWNILFDVADIPYLQTIYFGASQSIDQKLKQNFLHLTNLADTLLFISPTLRNLLEPEVLQGKKSLIVPNASDPNFFKATSLPTGKKKIILCVSGYAPQRGIEMLVDAFQRIHRKNRNILLRLVGHKMPSKLETEGVIIERNKYYSDIPEVFSNSFVCVIPHLKNPYMDSALPIKLFDAMASSRPSVVTNCLEMKKLVETEKCGLVSDCDAESLSEAIDYLISNTDVAEEMGLKGREAVEKRHSWRHRAEIIKRHLE